VHSSPPSLLAYADRHFQRSSNKQSSKSPQQKITVEFQAQCYICISSDRCSFPKPYRQVSQKLHSQSSCALPYTIRTSKQNLSSTHRHPTSSKARKGDRLSTLQKLREKTPLLSKVTTHPSQQGRCHSNPPPPFAPPHQSEGYRGSCFDAQKH